MGVDTQAMRHESLQHETVDGEKRFFTIGEVSAMCGIKAHVLRYWEHEFAFLRPTKRRGNRRYYDQGDVLLILKIRRLLYDEGVTIQGVRQRLGGGRVQEGGGRVQERHAPHEEMSARDALSSLHADLEDLHAFLLEANRPQQETPGTDASNSINSYQSGRGAAW